MDIKRLDRFSSVMSRFVLWWKDYFNVLVLSFTRISRDNVSIMASGMVYSTLIALVPAVTFLFAFFSMFGVLQPFIDLLTHFLVETLGIEDGASLIKMLELYTVNAMSLGVVGLVSFIFTSILLINKIYTVMNRIFRTQPRSGTLKRFVTFLTFLIVSAFIIVLLIAANSKLSAWAEITLSNNEYLIENNTHWESFLVILSVWGVLFAMIKFLPNAKIRFRSASVGATTGCLSVMIASEVFKYVIKSTVSYSVIYGSLASILFVLLFFYIIWYVVMVSSEITYVHQFRPDRGQLKGRPESPLSQITEGINLLLLVSDRYRSGKGATGEKELTRKLAIPTSKLYGYINCLEDGGLLLPVNAQRSSFVPALPLDKIMVRDVVAILYGSFRKDKDDVVTMGEAVAIELEEKGIKGFDNLNVENLLERL